MLIACLQPQIRRGNTWNCDPIMKLRRPDVEKVLYFGGIEALQITNTEDELLQEIVGNGMKSTKTFKLLMKLVVLSQILIWSSTKYFPFWLLSSLVWRLGWRKTCKCDQIWYTRSQRQRPLWKMLTRLMLQFIRLTACIAFGQLVSNFCRKCLCWIAYKAYKAKRYPIQLGLLVNWDSLIAKSPDTLYQYCTIFFNTLTLQTLWYISIVKVSHTLIKHMAGQQFLLGAIPWLSIGGAAIVNVIL